LETTLAPMDFWTRIMGFTEDEAQSIIDNAEEVKAQKEKEQAAKDAEVARVQAEAQAKIDATAKTAADATGTEQTPTAPGSPTSPGKPFGGKGSQSPTSAPPGASTGQPGGSNTVGNSDVGNAFCPTGPGGGVDPKCSPKSASHKKGDKATPQEEIKKLLRTARRLQGEAATKAEWGHRWYREVLPLLDHERHQEVIGAVKSLLVKIRTEQYPGMAEESRRVASLGHTLGVSHDAYFNLSAAAGALKEAATKAAKAERHLITAYRRKARLRRDARSGRVETQNQDPDVDNAFCPTGSGGGVDPSCSPKSGESAGGGEVKHIAHDSKDLVKLREEVANFPAGPRREEAIQALKPSRHDVVIALHHEGSLVGVASVWKTPDTAEEGMPSGQYIRIRNMATAKAGTGKDLLNAIYHHAASQGAGVYLSSLSGSSRFYETSGFNSGVGSTWYLTASEVKSRIPTENFDSSQHLDSLDTNAKAALSGGRWVTIEGRHVYLKGGKIVAGPPDLKGETLASAQVKVSAQTSEGTGKGASETKSKPDKTTTTKPAASKTSTTTEPATAPDKEHATPNRSLPDQARPTLHEHEARAIKGYTVYAKELNASLRSGDKLSEMDSKIHEGLTSAFGRAKDFKEPVNVYRGMRLPASDQGAFIKRITEAHAKGEEITIPGYMSTSTSQKEAKAFATANNAPTKVVLEVKAKRGLDLQSFSYVPEQKEFLLDHNSKFTVGSVKKRGELTYVTLEHR
jgi:hypothetical protein